MTALRRKWPLPAGARWLGLVAVMASLGALSFADGGYGGLALGATTAVIWTLVGFLALTGSIGRVSVGSGTLVAAGCLAGLAALTALSLRWAGDDGSGFLDVVRIGAYLGVFLLASLLVRRGEAGPVLAALATVGTGIAIAALASRLLGIGEGDSGLAAAQPAASGRLSYPIGYWNGLGALTAMTFPLLVWLGSHATVSRARPLALALIPVVLLAAYMTSSRGALLAALVGAGVMVVPGGRRALHVLLAGILLTLPAIVAASTTDGILTSPGTGVGEAELTVLVALLAPMLPALVFGSRVIGAAERMGRMGPRIPARYLLVALAAAAVAVVLAAGPSGLVGDFRGTPKGSRTAGGSGIVSTSGSGRAQFWATALEAFADEPGRGVGAGGYAAYWTRNGSLSIPTRNAHSEPLELAAELGAPGLVLFAGFFVTVIACGVGRARGPDGPVAGAALGLLIAGLIGICIDWTWDIPALAVPVLIAAGLLAGPAFGSERLRASARAGPRVRALSEPACTLALVLVAVPMIWAGGVLLIASSALESSEDALQRGDLATAAAKARSAAAVEPWAAEPWAQLATVELAAGNLEASRAADAEAIRLAPGDYRLWVLAATIAARADQSQVSGAYTLRAVELAPRLFGRAVLDPAT